MIATLLVLLCGAVAAAVYLWKKCLIATRELYDMTDDRDVQAFKARDAENARQRLQESLNTYTHKLERMVLAAEADADRLAPFVKNFIADMDVISAKLGTIDNKPLDLSDEREAIRLHEEAVKLRTK